MFRPATDRSARSLSPSWAVAIALVLGLIVPAAVVLMLDYQQARNRAELALQNDLAHLGDVLAVAFAEPIWQYAPEQAAPLMRALQDDPRIVSVRIEGRGMKRPLVNHQGIVAFSAEMKTREQPVMRNGELIGTLTLTMSAEPYLMAAREEMLRDLRGNLIAVTVALGVTLALLRRRLLRPLAQLASDARRLAEGDLDRPIGTTDRGDVGDIGRALETMRSQLKPSLGAQRDRPAMPAPRTSQQHTESDAGAPTPALVSADHETTRRHLLESEQRTALGRLLADVAHQLNAPITNAMNVVCAIEDRHGDFHNRVARGEALRRQELLDLLDTARGGYELLRRDVTAAAALIAHFKQVAVDRASEQRRSFDLADAIHEALDLQQARLPQAAHHLVRVLDPGLTMDSYPGPLGQVVVELVTNALTHAFAGREHGQITVRCHRLDAAHVHLSCSDDGNGMPPDVQARAVEPFFTTQSGMNGLGLAVTRSLVHDLLGGRITIDSAPGRGTRVLIELPRCAPH